MQTAQRAVTARDDDAQRIEPCAAGAWRKGEARPSNIGMPIYIASLASAWHAYDEYRDDNSQLLGHGNIYLRDHARRGRAGAKIDVGNDQCP